MKNKDNTLDLTRKAVLNVLLYIETKNDNQKLVAQDALKDLASYYHVTVKEVPKIDIMAALKQFLEANNGAQEIINKLYYSL